MTTHADRHPGSPERLARIVRGRRPPAPRTPQPINLEPTSVYEAITRQMVDDLAREYAALRSRLDSIFYIIVGSIVVDVFVRLVG